MTIETATKYLRRLGPGVRAHMARIASASLATERSAAGLGAELFIRRIFAINPPGALLDHGVDTAQVERYVEAGKVYALALAEKL